MSKTDLEYQEYRKFTMQKGRSPIGKRRYIHFREWCEFKFNIESNKL